MRVEIDVAGRENKTTAELKRIRAEAMLSMARGRRALPRLGVVAAQQVQNVRRLQTGRSIREALRIDQQRKCDPSLLAKEARIAHVAKTDRSEIGTLRLELLLVFAQLRDVLAAEDSTVMTQEDDNRRSALPQRAEPHLALVRIRKRYV